MKYYRLKPALPEDQRILVAGDSADRGNDRILLGSVQESGRKRELWLDISSEQVVGILGKRGTGKSYTLGVILEGLSASSADSKIAVHKTPRAALVLDILDIFWTSSIPLSDKGSNQIRKQYETMHSAGIESEQIDTSIWIPAGYENSRLDPPQLNSLHLSAFNLDLDDWGSLFEVNIFSEPRGMLINDVINMVAEDGYHTQSGFVNSSKYFTFQQIIDCLNQSTELEENFNSETIRSIKQRAQTYARLALFKGKPTKLEDLIQPRATSILMLGRVPDALKNVIVSVLLRQIMRQRRDASFARKRLDLASELTDEEKLRLENVLKNNIPRTWVLLDEAHVLAGKEASVGKVAKNSLIKYAKEGRNFGLSLCVATQQPSALDSRLMSQVESLVLHQLTAVGDVDLAKSSIRSPHPDNISIDSKDIDTSQLLRSMGQGVAIFSTGNGLALPRYTVIKIRPRITAHGGYEA